MDNFDSSAIVISEEMRKWDNAGFISEGKDIRLFMGGDSEAIKYGLAYVIVHLAEQVDDCSVIADIANSAKGIYNERQMSIKQ